MDETLYIGVRLNLTVCFAGPDGAVELFLEGALTDLGVDGCNTTNIRPNIVYWLEIQTRSSGFYPWSGYWKSLNSDMSAVIGLMPKIQECDSLGIVLQVSAFLVTTPSCGFCAFGGGSATQMFGQRFACNCS